MAEASLFGKWECRPYQVRLWDYLNGGGKRAIPVWHRRSGKDDVSLRWSALSMIRDPGSYWYMLPLKDQGRTAIWTSVNKHTGRRRIDEAFPDSLFEKRDTDMMITCKANASTWQVKGSDNYGAGIGSSPAGIVFSEYSRADPNAWAFLRPILKENNGWAIFPSTPFGHNHFENLYRYAISEIGQQDGWFGELLTAADTGIFSADDIEQEKREIAGERNSPEEAEAIVQQEYFCDFNSAIPGAIYARLLGRIENMDPPRITRVPHDPGFAVQACTDLGATEGNDLAVWWFQTVGKERRFIDCDSATGVGIDWLAERLNERGKKNYVYAEKAVLLPHDAGHAQVSNAGAASFAKKLYRDYGYTNKVNPVTDSVAWSIDQTKHFIMTCVFDNDGCAKGLSALRHYHRKWDPVRKTYSDKPVHDWSSNYADAFRTASEAMPVVRAGQSLRQRVPYAAMGEMGVLMPANAGTAIDYDDCLGRY